jgi:lipid-A-disaccharide synthase
MQTSTEPEPRKVRCFISAGEASGDQHGAALVAALRQEGADWNFSGISGPMMRAEKVDPILPMEELQVMGLADVLLALPKLYKHFYTVKKWIIEQKPDLVILIDYPGFHLRLAKSLRKSGFQGKLIHYIAPTVWAHGKKRADVIAENYDLLLTIYPFEKKYFEKSHLSVEYVGNPLLGQIKKYIPTTRWEALCPGIESNKKLIGLFPGSRKKEIELNLPLQLKTAEKLLLDDPSLIFAIPIAHEKLRERIEFFISQSTIQLNQQIFLIESAYRYDLMRNCTAALATSGTVTLELGLHKVPTVMVYKLSLIDLFFVKCILRLNLPHYCIVNIIQGRTIFPELIHTDFTPETAFTAMKQLIGPGEHRETVLRELDALAASLGESNASTHAAMKIIEVLDGRL